MDAEELQALRKYLQFVLKSEQYCKQGKQNKMIDD